MQNATAQKLSTNLISDRDELIIMHLGMALKMARKMARRLPSSVSRDDVESAALLGLTEAATRYDTTRQEPFMAFAAKRVRGAILDHLRKNDILSRRARQGARRVAEATRDLEAELGRAPIDAEIAAAMGMSEMAFNRAYANIREAAVIHLDDLRGELSDGHRTGANVGERQRRKAALITALEVLDEREQMVLSCYYREGLTLREIGTILGVTESRVCQLHTQALSMLRNRLS
ncbi:MAG: FliA/WhiG family RNA polymerase sigma factor [Myxococcales bacterium]|nr:FliA/WhiG family RNA polymerase sigma factor [Myxococcales bacterium]